MQAFFICLFRALKQAAFHTFYKVNQLSKGGDQMILQAIFQTLPQLIRMIFALHVTGGHSFPKPLSAKQERECLKRIKEGDPTARNELIEHNLRLVVHIIKKYYQNARDQDDLISIGTIGLIKAANTFDYDKGNKFTTYASRCIENAILSQVSLTAKINSF